MGLLKHLLFWPVTGPAYLTRFSLEKVEGLVREELTDDGPIKEALLDLQLRLELGEVDEAVYIEEEARLLARLREVRDWRETFGMGVRGGLVQAPGGAARTSDAGEADPPESAATMEISLDWHPLDTDG